MHPAPESIHITEEHSAILTECSPAIHQLWIRKAGVLWQSQDAHKIALLQAEIEHGTDTFSLALKNEYTGDTGQLPIPWTTVEKVRRSDYTSSDLFNEYSLLLESIDEVLHEANLISSQILAISSIVKRRLMHLFNLIFLETADIYEESTEAGNRGYCHVNQVGTITYANPEMVNLWGGSPTGLSVYSIFKDQNGFLANALDGTLGKRPGLRVLKMARPDGTELPVHASVGQVSRAGVNRAYIVISDLSKIISQELAVLEKMPLGVAHLDLTQKVLYANSRMAEYFGVAPAELIGCSIQELAVNSQHAVLRQKLKERKEGFSDEYPLTIKRRDNDREVRIRVAAMPVQDNDGVAVSIIVIASSLEVQDVAAQLHEIIEQSDDLEELLHNAAQATRVLVPWDEVVVSAFSDDKEHNAQQARVLASATRAIPVQTRWHPIARPLVDFMLQPGVISIPDLDAFHESDQMRELRDSPDARAYRENYGSALIVAITRKRRLLATVSWLAKEKKRFGPQHSAALEELPIRHIVSRGMYLWKQGEQRFRYRLLLRVARCATIEEMARTIVEGFAEHYKWDNVSIFGVNEVSARLELKSQAMGCVSGFLLPEGHWQPTSVGLLGVAYRTRRAVNVGDVIKRAREVGDYLSSNRHTRSEICAPVVLDGRVRWILNVEDSKYNAFTKVEEIGICRFFDDTSVYLEHLFRIYTFDELLRSSSDMIVITDARGFITEFNAAAEELLSVRRQEVIGKLFGDLFADVGVWNRTLIGSETQHVEVDLKRPGRGQTTKLLLSARLLPSEFDRRVYFGREWSAFQKQVELKAIEFMFHEIAMQVRTPLAVAEGSLQMVRAAAPAVAGEIGSVLRQLKRVDLSFDRLLLYGRGRDSIPFNAVTLNLSDLFAELLDLLPRSYRAALDISIGARPILLHGDPFLFFFCVETVISYFLRHLPDGEQIRVRAGVEEGYVELRISGVLPDDAADGSLSFAPQLTKARIHADLSLGQDVVREIVERHSGIYTPARLEDGRTVFGLRLPCSLGGES